MKKRIMVIGPTSSGKTTLIYQLENISAPLARTVDVIYRKNTIEVPGAYIENSWMYKHLIAIAQQQASKLLFLADQSQTNEEYSPKFATIFTRPVYGVVTKTDLCPENQKKTIFTLKELGISPPYYFINQCDNESIQELKSIIWEGEE